jgi:hypothetical protein
MYIKAKDKDGIVCYVNADKYCYFAVFSDKLVEMYSADNLKIDLQNTSALIGQLETLLPKKDSPQFKDFN